jgi:hypothetical protein
MHPLLWLAVLLAAALVATGIAFGVLYAVRKKEDADARTGSKRVEDYEEAVAAFEGEDMSPEGTKNAPPRPRRPEQDTREFVLPRPDAASEAGEIESTRANLLALWVDFSTAASAQGLAMFPVHSTYRAARRQRVPDTPFMVVGVYGHDAHKLVAACDALPETIHARLHPYMDDIELATDDLENECDVVMRREGVAIYVQLVLADDVYPRATPPRPQQQQQHDTAGSEADGACASEVVYFLRDGTVVDTARATPARYFGATVQMLDEKTAASFDIMDVVL